LKALVYSFRVVIESEIFFTNLLQLPDLCRVFARGAPRERSERFRAPQSFQEPILPRYSLALVEIFHPPYDRNKGAIY
jgi:hypothetical protein